MNASTLKPVAYLLQAFLIAIVVGWILNIPAKLNVALYTEQFLAAALGFTLALTFILVPGTRRAAGRVPWIDVAASAVGFASCAYVAVRYPSLVTELVYRPVDGIVVATLIVALVMEATRRTAGLALVLIILVLCAYAMLGHLLPDAFASRPVALSRLMVYLGVDTNALLGSALQIAVIVVVPFVIMGQILNRCGGSDFFTDVSMALMGRRRGGSAKIAVFGSGLFGMVSGSAVANVASVGTITIPLMKRAGFPAHIAGAIEAVGSTGGQLMPPVMGAAAFLMAEYLQVPYSEVMIAAVLPAFLYYAALFFQVDFEAGKRGILGARPDEIPAIGRVLREGWHFPIPFALLVIALLSWNMEAEYAALLATVVLLLFATTVGYRGKRLKLSEALDATISAGGAVIDIIIITAVSGVLIGVLNLTGLAFGLTMQLMTISGGDLLPLLVVTAVVALVLGLGLPTVGVYVILATLAAPSLVKAGLSPMQAHLYVLFHGMLSMVTPPVALAAFAAANIAQSDQWRTGWTATRIGWCAYFIPFLFAFSPRLLMVGEVWQVIEAAVTASLGVYLGSAAVVGYLRGPLSRPARLVCAVVAAALLIPLDLFAGAGLVKALGALGATAIGVRAFLRVRRDVVSAAPPR